MTQSRLLIGLFCAFSACAMAAPAPAEKEVAQAVDHLTQAMLHKDIAELNALTAPNLTYGHSSGKIQDKQEFIADIETGRSAFKTLGDAEADHYSVRRYRIGAPPLLRAGVERD